MGLSKLFLTLKGGAGSGNHEHSGRPGKRGGSSPKSFINPKSIEEIGQQIKHNLEKFDLKRQKVLQEMGMDYQAGATNFYTRVPGVIDPKTGEITIHGLSGRHSDMRYMGSSESWVDNYTRFGLVFDKDFKKVVEVQLNLGTAGVDWADKKFEDKAYKRIYSAMDKLSKIEGLKGVRTTIELTEWDDNIGQPKVVETVI